MPHLCRDWDDRSQLAMDGPFCSRFVPVGPSPGVGLRRSLCSPTWCTKVHKRWTVGQMPGAGTSEACKPPGLLFGGLHRVGLIVCPGLQMIPRGGFNPGQNSPQFLGGHRSGETSHRPRCHYNAHLRRLSKCERAEYSLYSALASRLPQRVSCGRFSSRSARFSESQVLSACVNTFIFISS